MSSTSINAISIPISDYAAHIEEDLREYLVQPPEGIYFRAQTKPLVLGTSLNVKGRGFTQKVSTQGQFQTIETPLDDLGQLTGDLYQEGNLLIRKPQDGWKPTDFHHRPIVPVVGLRIVKEYADNVIDNHVKWRGKVDGFHRLLDRYIVSADRQRVSDIDKPLTDTIDPVLGAFCEERVRGVLSYLADDIARFVHLDPWHMYLTQQRRNSDLMVLKTKDYRVSEWERLKAEGKI